MSTAGSCMGFGFFKMMLFMKHFQVLKVNLYIHSCGMRMENLSSATRSERDCHRFPFPFPGPYLHWHATFLFTPMSTWNEWTVIWGDMDTRTSVAFSPSLLPPSQPGSGSSSRVLLQWPFELVSLLPLVSTIIHSPQSGHSSLLKI